MTQKLIIDNYLPLLFKDAAKNFLIHLPRYIETIPKVILKPFV